MLDACFSFFLSFNFWCLKTIFIQGLRVGVDPPSTQANREFPTPETVKNIARFLVMVNYFHNFVPNLTQIAAPLNALRKKGVGFH